MPEADLVSIRKLEKHFRTGGELFARHRSLVHALNGVDLEIRRGETVGIVGESGCGKSTLARCVLRLEEPSSGEILFENRNVLELGPRDMREVRRDMQIIFQDPYASLNPRKTAGSIIGEGLRVHGIGSRSERAERVRELIAMVGLRPEHADRFPHEFSGGQRQRIGIARALSLNPKLVVADEAVSALDVSVQAQVLNLLVSLQRRLGLTYLFISHDLGVVRHISDRVGVMYLGKIVELAQAPTLYKAPAHPYTEALLAAVPRTRAGGSASKPVLAGDVPSASSIALGCSFHSRCRYGQDRCRREAPPLAEIAPGHFAACHFPLNRPSQGAPNSRRTSDAPSATQAVLT